MKYRGTPAYTPMCNSHLRFYFSNPERMNFRNEIEKRQFQTVKTIMSSLPYNEFEIVKELILPDGEPLDILDSYLKHRIERKAVETGRQPGYYYGIFNKLTKRIAIELHYISVIRNDNQLK